MTLQALMDQTGTRIRPTDVGGGRYNSHQDLSVAGARATYRCRLERSSASELEDDRATIVSEWILFLPHDADVQANDLWEQDGLSFEVVGPPESARTRGHVDHIEARLRFVKG